MINKEELKDCLEFAKDFYLGGFRSMVPWTYWEKERHVNYLNNLKDFYQPKIEEKTGVDLGDVKVKKYVDKIDGIYYDRMQEEIEKHMKPNIDSPLGLNYLELLLKKTPNDLWMIDLSFRIIFPLVKSLLEFQNQMISGLTYENNSIYIPTGWSHRFVHYVYKEKWDSVIVHELSHCLWDKISNSSSKDELVKMKNKEGKIFTKWIEGFASYCEHDYFFDLYKEKVKEIKRELLPEELSVFTKSLFFKNSHLQLGVYTEGRKKIKEVVDNYGLEAVLEVPKRWEEFEKELYN